MNNTPVKLIVTEEDSLATPFDLIQDELTREHFTECAKTNPFKPEGERTPDDPLLVTMYGSGDCDVAKWPLTTPERRKILAGALYDAREIGTIPDVAEVILPDGSTFVIDAELGR